MSFPGMFHSQLTAGVKTGLLIYQKIKLNLMAELSPRGRKPDFTQSRTHQSTILATCQGCLRQYLSLSGLERKKDVRGAGGQNRFELVKLVLTKEISNNLHSEKTENKAKNR